MVNSQIKIPRRRQPRNAHLIPEVVERQKRILKQAKYEENQALDAYKFPVEIFKPKTNGRVCTCQFLIKEQNDDTVLSSDFLLENILTDNSNFCPLCFDQKFIGGYDKLNNNLIVLDYTNGPSVNKVSLIKDLPHWYKPSNITGTLTWRLFIPKYFSGVEIAIKWHKEKEPTSWNLTLNDIDILDGLEQYAGEKVDIKLSMKDSSSEEVGLYGIFIYFKVNSKIVNADLPRYIRSFTGEKNIVDEVESPITINFDSNVKKPNSQSVVIDENGIIWRILSVDTNNPTDVDISYTCQARVVRRFESIFQLPSKLIKINYNPNLYTFI